MSNLVSPYELVDIIHSGRPYTTLDASWYLPTQESDAYQYYGEKHIPGAHFFDIDAVSDHASAYPHMLPSAELFSDYVANLGIDSETLVVVYDQQGMFSVARVWWMFRAFNHSAVKVLNGGLPAWEAAGLSVNNEVVKPSRAGFTAVLNSDFVVDLKTMVECTGRHDAHILDARPRDRFLGRAPEPRVGISSGHMPNAVSLPFTDLLEDGRLKETPKLLQIFSDLGVEPGASVVTTCGSGVTAAIINLALDESGYQPQKLYDGAWAEWADQSSSVIIKEDS